MSLGAIIAAQELEHHLIDAGRSAYKAAFLSRHYARSVRANVFSEHRHMNLQNDGYAVISYTSGPWSSRRDILFIVVESVYPISTQEYDAIIEYGARCAPEWGMNQVLVTLTSHNHCFRAAVQNHGFHEAMEGVIVLTDLHHPVLDELAEPPLGDVEITPLCDVIEAPLFSKVAQFVASNYRSVPMPFEIGKIDEEFVYGEIMDEATVKPASMVMHTGDDVCGYCHVVDWEGAGIETEWPTIVVDPRLRGRGIGFAASIRALTVTRALGFTHDISLAAKSNVAVEKQYVGYGGEIVGQFWKYMLDL